MNKTFETYEFASLPTGIEPEGEWSEVYCNDDRCAHNSHDAGAWGPVARCRVEDIGSTYVGGAYTDHEEIYLLVEFEQKPGVRYFCREVPYHNGNSVTHTWYSREQIEKEAAYYNNGEWCKCGEYEEENNLACNCYDASRWFAEVLQRAGA